MTTTTTTCPSLSFTLFSLNTLDGKAFSQAGIYASAAYMKETLTVFETSY